MSDVGKWIKLQKSVVNHWVFKDDPDFFRAWISLLIFVNWREGKKVEGNRIIKTQIGERYTSESELTEKLFLKKKKLNRFLNLLQDDNMIEIERSRKGTRLRVLEYKRFQGKGDHRGTTPILETTDKNKNNCEKGTTSSNDEHSALQEQGNHRGTTEGPQRRY